MEPRIDELRRQIRRIDEEAASGALSAPLAKEKRAQLERELLDLVVAATPPPAAAARARPSGKLLAGLTAFVLVLAVAGYAWQGNLDALRGVAPAAAGGPEGGHANNAAQIEAMVGKLQDRLKAQPDDAEGWSMLGRSYSVLGRYPDAVAAFKRVAVLRPTDAQALADQADATAMAAGRKLAGEPEQLITKALQLDPKNLKALALAGTIAFDRNDFAGAARHWEAAVAVAEPGSELARNLQAGIGEARSRAGQPPVAAAAPGATPPAAPAAQGATAAAPAGRIGGRIQLAAALQGKAAPEDTLFVFARAVDGPRAPLAILRKQVKDLPLDFTLDDSMAMNPALRLSAATGPVIVGARISKTGNAIGQPGDMQGLSPPVAVGTRELKIEIAEVVK